MGELGAVLGLATACVGGLLVARLLLAYRDASSRVFFRLTFPRELTEQAAVAAIRALAGLRPGFLRALVQTPSVAFELVATDQGITQYVAMPRTHAAFVTGQLRAALPGLRIEPVDAPALPRCRRGVELARRGSGTLRTDALSSVAAGVLAATQPLGAGEVVRLQWVVSPLARLPWAALAERWSTSPERSKARPAEPVFAVGGRAGADASTGRRAGQLVSALVAAVRVSEGDDARLTRRFLPSRLAARRLRRGLPSFGAAGVLDAAELAGLVGIPAGGPQLPGLTLTTARVLPPPAPLAHTGIVLGRTLAAGTEREAALSLDALMRHMAVLAPTGAGKSTALLNLATQLMAAGVGLVVLESKGDLVDDLVARVPAARVDDVVLLDPADAARPVGVNLISGTDAERTVDDVVSIFRQRFGSYLGPRSESVLRAGLLTLSYDPELTICELPLLLSEPGFRRRLLARVDDPLGLGPFWQWYESLPDGEQRQVIDPLRNKLDPFILRRRVRQLVGQPRGGLDLAGVLERGGIFFGALRKGVLGEDVAGLVGGVLVARLWQLALARAAVPAEQRRPVVVIVDEFQDYVGLGTSFADGLAQARSYKVGFVLANQSLTQLPPDVRAALLNNARSKLVFQTSATDARLLAREFAPHVEAADLMGLGPFEAYFAAADPPRVLPPVSIATYPPPPPSGEGARVRERSRERYGRDAGEVEAALIARRDGLGEPALIGRRRRES
ncbi:MAG: type IV secretory system conjugative DNA transfer family protein [Conexibacter sp.]